MDAHAYKGGGPASASGGGGANVGSGAGAKASLSLADRWANANRKFDLAERRKKELRQIIATSPWTHKRFEEAFDKIVSERNAVVSIPNQTEEKKEEAGKIFTDFLVRSSKGREELRAVEDELDAFPKQESWIPLYLHLQRLRNSFMEYEVGDCVMNHSGEYSVTILDKKLVGEKYEYKVQINGIVIISPERFKIMCEDGVLNIKDIYETKHDYLVFRAEEEGDREKHAAWPAIFLKMKQDAYVAEMKAPAEEKIAKAMEVIADADKIATFPTRFAHVVVGTRCWWKIKTFSHYGSPETQHYDGKITSIDPITFMCKIVYDNAGSFHPAGTATKRIDTLNF
jgi:hypothetical protein